MQIKDLIYASDIDMVTEQELFRKTKEIKELLKTERGRKALAEVFTKDDKFLELFSGASTRTDLTFTNAVEELGGRLHPRLWQFSSMVKGEPMESLVHLCNGIRYKGIIMRHDGDDAEALMKEALATREEWNYPIRFINAGMSNKEHPTQRLIDIFTIQELFPDELLQRASNHNQLRIVLSGDLEYSRTMQSLVIGLAPYGPVIWTTSPQDNCIPESTRNFLRENNIEYHEYHRPLKEVMQEAEPHICYLSRLQLNLRPWYMQLSEEEQKRIKAELEPPYIEMVGINREVLSVTPSYTKVLHPLPQGQELPKWFSRDQRATYHEQQANGLPIRMALLIMMFAPNTDLRLLHQDKQIITVHAKTENRGTFSMPTEIGNISKLCICQGCENHTGQCTAVESKLSGTWGFISEKDFNSIVGKGQSPCNACRPRL